MGQAKDTVKENNTTKALRSWELNAYAIPAMIALMEEEAYKSVQGRT